MTRGKGAAVGVAVSFAAAGALAGVEAAAPPGFQYYEASGCGGLILYAWNEARTEVLVVRVNQDRIHLPNGETELTIAPANTDLQVSVEVTDRARDDFPYCSGESSAAAPEVWSAASGRVKLVVNRRPNAVISPVSVLIDRLVLAGANGAEVKQRGSVRFAAAIADPIK
jgi:hypothetical protein